MFILVVTAVLLPLLWLLLNKTNLGLVIRAGTSDNLMVQLLGINVARTWTITYALGAALAAFAGVITAPLVAVAPEMGGLVLIECFIVTVVGGMGSFLGRRRGRAPHRRDAGPHRHGLRRARRRRHLPRDGPRAARAPARTLRSGGDVRGVKGLVLAALVLATAPLYADYTPFYLGLLTEVLVFGLFALAYDVLLGHAGVLSLGHSAFLGVAAYVTGILLARYHAPARAEHPGRRRRRPPDRR